MIDVMKKLIGGLKTRGSVLIRGAGGPPAMFLFVAGGPRAPRSLQIKPLPDALTHCVREAQDNIV